MYLQIKSAGPHAGMISHLLAKNPYNLYDRQEKGARVRLLFPVFTEQEMQVLLFVTPDPIDLVKGSPDSYDITNYINDREFVVSSLFCSYIRPALGTALNGKPKADYAQWVDYRFPLEVSVGPVSSNLPDDVLSSLFTALGYEVELERGESDYSFQLKKRSTIRVIHLRGEATIQNLLRQLFILLPVLDDYKHYYIGDEEVERLQRYGEGWLTKHPQHRLIVKRALRFMPLIRQYSASLPLETQDMLEQPEETQEMLEQSEDGSGERDGTASKAIAPEDHLHTSSSPVATVSTDVVTDDTDATLEVVSAAVHTVKAPRLNELRYQAVVEQIGALPQRQTIIDFGAGEGKLSERLARIGGVKQVWAVEPSAYAGVRALERFADMQASGAGTVPQLATGSLFYRDDRWSGADVMILCEVIEHIDALRLPMVMRTLLDEYRPQTLILTTPNREYNAVYEMEQDDIRHTDHRFEWSRQQFADFCREWSKYGGYEMNMHGIGEVSVEYGQPTQMAVFHKQGGKNK
ncbi:methyltransferase domain-containing protein [Paenibacillus sp. WLX2291]|uniref:methyltransferase domain-containing protein n=1 Tax=Paenibacillus sp. WLX2291 TaxID=3296934 RepID=UPI003983FA76